ncbi:MAG: hypothetical protein HFI75_06245 [Lachnospiraceae bacterium]|nr:hypothetical protein [Lachnospiraceae bacterium]
MLNSTSNSIKNAINATSTISGMLKNNYIAAGLASLANGGLSGNCGGPGGGAKFAKGGVITSRHGYLKPLARAVGEDTMVAARYGERILTPKQNEAFEKFMESVPDIVAAHLDIPGFHSDNPYPSFPSDSRPVDNSITLNAPLVEVNGSIHHEDMKHIEKMVDKKLNHLQHKQNVALRTYMGIK